MVSYVIAPDRSSIMCGTCGMISWDPRDVRLHYCGNCHCFHDDVQMIAFYVIYDHPSDYPNDYVLRKQASIFVPGQPPESVQEAACRVGSLEEMRSHVPMGAVCLGRYGNDDPKIVEVWML